MSELKKEYYKTHTIWNKGGKSPMEGKTHSEETKRKMSESQKGMHWFTDGEKNVKAFECPDGFHPGA